MGTYDHFKRNEDREQQGITLDLGGVGKFKMARAGGSNKRYQQCLERGMRPHRKAFQQGTLNEEVANKILLDTFIDSVLLGWDGVTDQNGKAMPYTKDNARKLMGDLPDLFVALRDAASDMSLFRDEEQQAADTGN